MMLTSAVAVCAPSRYGLACTLTLCGSVAVPDSLMSGILAFAASAMAGLMAVGDVSAEMMMSTFFWTSVRICWACCTAPFAVFVSVGI